ncbi:uncharacterized protein LOC117331799 isoform X1 [Pecten maximus]|uniref:uncharacterized protein LOC117331799 isoform X1 n=1 Tax=Pecten maximus TaxID=6579 RepID=UPI001458F179|nr:uncharacterized protein LOC117331799 isoform X1 [Pecten maximus]
MTAMLRIVIFLLELSLGLGFRKWKAPDSIPIQCGDVKCDIWTQYCHNMVCRQCNPDVCNQALGPGGRPLQCYFYCTDVKEKMQIIVFKDGTSSTQQTTDRTITTTLEHKTPPENDESRGVTPNTISMVVIPLVTYVAGIVTVHIFQKCNKKRNRKSSKDKINNQPPQGSHSSISDPKDYVELAISNKLLGNVDLDT